jgi:hypothetical protein
MRTLIIQGTTVTFNIVREVGDQCYCEFKVDTSTDPFAFTNYLYCGSQFDVVEKDVGSGLSVYMIAISVNDSPYSTKMTGSCVFQLLSEYTRFDTLLSLV